MPVKVWHGECNTVVIYLYGSIIRRKASKLGVKCLDVGNNRMIFFTLNDVQHGGRQRRSWNTLLFLAPSTVHDPGGELPPEVFARDRAVNE